MIKPRNENPAGMSRTTSSATIDSSQVTLTGLTDFIAKREFIRKMKESGQPRPWTTDEVLDKTRFANIYRQDDKVSKLIFSKVEALTGVTLVYNLLMSRLINRNDVLDNILPLSLDTDLSHLLDGEAVIMNSTAYQVSPGVAAQFNRTTVREVIIYDVRSKAEAIHRAMTSTDQIADAISSGNKAFGGRINFVMFQVVLDYHYLTGHYDESSPIPIGQGAKDVVAALGGLEKLMSDTGMKSWDVEHAACEYRKYLYRQDKVLSRYSYKPNSMGI